MIEAITANTNPAFAVTAAQQRAGLSRDQFLQILVAELTNQDPLDPMDNAQFLQQLVSMQTLEQTSVLTDTLQSFQKFMQMSSASALVGRIIKGISAEGNSIEGIVDKIVMEKGSVTLHVGTHRVPFQGVQEILS